MSIAETDHHLVIVVADMEEGIRNRRDGFGLTLTHTKRPRLSLRGQASLKGEGRAERP